MCSPPDEKIGCIVDLSEALHKNFEKIKDPIIAVGRDFYLTNIHWDNLKFSSTSSGKKIHEIHLTFSLHALDQVNMTKTRTNRARQGINLDLLATSQPQIITSLAVVDGTVRP